MYLIGELMKDLGFRHDSSLESQKAFIKNLIHAAYGAEVKNIDDYRESRLCKSHPTETVGDSSVQLNLFA